MLPGLLFGLGFGGFVDGIVLREILQWHHMISGAQSSETLAGLELNVVADGFFHVVTWLLVMAGSIMTLVSWRQGRACALHGRFTSGCWWPGGASSTSLKD